MSSPPNDQLLLVLMFTDLVDSSALKVKLGDRDYANNIARPHNRLFRDILSSIPGAREISYTGDGFLASFLRVSDAVNAALRFQTAIREHPWQGPSGVTRIGIHVGEAVVSTDPGAGEMEIISHAADMCARVMSLAQGGQILLTRHAFDDARQFVRDHPRISQSDEHPHLQWMAHGRYRLKGKDEDPLEIFEVGATNYAPLAPPPDSEKAHRVVDADEFETLGWRPSIGLQIPDRPNWLIDSKLGEGGFGEVWLARHSKTKQSRVYKFCFDPERLRSFKRELTLFRLIQEALGDRDDVVPLFDIRLDKPPFYLESEYIPTGNLLNWCESRGGVQQVPLTTRLEILAQVAETVGAIHSLGIIHKDIKPSNVLIRELRGGVLRPLLADFGIGAVADRALLERHEITAAGFTETVMDSDSSRTGTRLYTPPESLIGKPASAARDVYALGVLLYQLVNGSFDQPLGAGWEDDIVDELLCADIAVSINRNPLRRIQAIELADRLRQLQKRRSERSEERNGSKATLLANELLEIVHIVSEHHELLSSATTSSHPDAKALGARILESAHEALSQILSKSRVDLSDNILKRISQVEDVKTSANTYHQIDEYQTTPGVPPVIWTSDPVVLSMDTLRRQALTELERRTQIDENLHVSAEATNEPHSGLTKR